MKQVNQREKMRWFLRLRIQNLVNTVIPALEQTVDEMKTQGFSVEDTAEEIIGGTEKRAKALA